MVADLAGDTALGDDERALHETTARQPSRFEGTKHGNRRLPQHKTLNLAPTLEM